MKKFLIFLGVVFGISLCDFCGVFATDENIPEIFIRAINPGYTIDGKSNVGEMIEISRKNSDEMVSLAGITISYTNSSGNDSILFEFPENSFMSGESILLRLASSPESELAAVNYTKTLAFKGGITLKKGDEILDGVCWTGKDGCSRDFKSAEPTSLVRNLETGEFEHVFNYKPIYDEKSYFEEEIAEEKKPSRCRGLIFSEVLSYYESLQSEQFIEIYNSGFEQVLMDGCKLKYKNRFYELSGILKPEEYFVYFPKEFSLTKNPTNVGVVELADFNDEILDKLEYPNGQRKGTSYAFIGYDESGDEIWRTTYAPTPGEPNNYQEFKSCEVGKVLNKETGNCVKVTSVAEKVCADGQYLNPLTGRCNKIKTVAERTCKEGYELNLETGRCRKVKENTGANYSLVPEEYEEGSTFVALYVVVGIIIAGLVYLIFEFRREIKKLFGKVFRRFR